MISPQKRNEEKDKLLRDAEELGKKIATLKAAQEKTRKTNTTRKPAQIPAAKAAPSGKVCTVRPEYKN